MLPEAKKELVQKFNEPVLRKKSYHFSILSGMFLSFSIMFFINGSVTVGYLMVTGTIIGALTGYVTAKKELFDTKRSGFAMAVLDQIFDATEKKKESPKNE